MQLIPVLICADIAGEHDFLVQTLGFESGGLERSPGGDVVHGEVRAGDQRIWLHLTTDKLDSPRRSGAATAGMVVHVPDVDAHFRRVQASGAEVLSQPTDQPYGQREYGVKDPEGHSWWIATATAKPAAR